MFSTINSKPHSYLYYDAQDLNKKYRCDPPPPPPTPQKRPQKKTNNNKNTWSKYVPLEAAWWPRYKRTGSLCYNTLSPCCPHPHTASVEPWPPGYPRPPARSSWGLWWTMSLMQPPVTVLSISPLCRRSLSPSLIWCIQ